MKNFENIISSRLQFTVINNDLIVYFDEKIIYECQYYRGSYTYAKRYITEVLVMLDKGILREHIPGKFNFGTIGHAKKIYEIIIPLIRDRKISELIY